MVFFFANRYWVALIRLLITPFRGIAMKNRLISIVLGSALMVASSLAIANELPEGAVNMSKVLESLKSKGYNFIKEIKFDDGVYEVKAFNLDGNEVKIKIDPENRQYYP